MSSGDFNYVTLRNIVPFNADGSFVHTGYVLTVGPDAKQSWVNNLSLNALVVSTISVNSTVRFPAGIYDQLYVSSGTISTATIQTLAVTSTLQVSTITATNAAVSSFVGSSVGISTLTASTAWITQLTGCATSFSTLSASTIYFSTAFGSTVQASTLFASTLGFSTAAGSSLTVNTLSANEIDVNAVYYSTLTGSSIVTSSLQTNAAAYSTLTGSTSFAVSQTASSLTASTALLNALSLNNGLFSTLTGSSLTASTISASTIYFSTATGSSLITSTLSASTANISTLAASTILVCTLQGSTVNINNGTFSTLQGSSITASTLSASTINFSTATGSTFIVSTFSASTMAFSTAAGSTLVVSTFSGSTVNVNSGFFSTLKGSTLQVSSLLVSSALYSTMAGSSLTANMLQVLSSATISTVIANSMVFSTMLGSTLTMGNGTWQSTLQGSTLTATSVNYSTMLGSTIKANTMISGNLALGTGMTGTSYNLEVLPYGTVNLGGNYKETWTTIYGNGIGSDAAAFVATYNGTLSGPSGSPAAMLLTLGVYNNAVITYTGTLIPGNVYQVSFTASMTGPSPTFYLCNHLSTNPIDQPIPGTLTAYSMSNTYATYTVIFAAPSGQFGISFVSQASATASFYGFTLQGYYNLMPGALGIGTTVPQYALHAPLGSIQAYNFQQFEWMSNQSTNTLGSIPATALGYFKVATLGPTASSYGMINVRGTIGGIITSNIMYIDLSIMTRGGLKVWGTVNGSQAGSGICDLVYSVNAGKYDVYIAIKMLTSLVYDLVVSGASGTNTLYDPATASAITTVSSPQSLTALATMYTTAAGFVGIGKSNPAYAMDVVGSVNVTGSVLVNGVPVALTGGSWTQSGTSLYYIGGNVGIGTMSPAYGLDVVGDVNITGSYRVNGIPQLGGTGPTGPGGSGGGGGGGGGTVAILSNKADGFQTLVSGTPTLVLWPTADATQTTGSTGLSYSAGVFTNTTPAALPVLVEYAIFLNATGYGSSYIGLNGGLNTYGVMYNDTNGFTNSYTILIPVGGTIGIYYTDNNTPTIQNTSRVTLSILNAGVQGPTGPGAVLASVATLSLTAGAQQIVGEGTGTLVQWAAVDAAQTNGTTGLTYAVPTGTFVNTTTSTLPFLVEYTFLTDLTGGGASWVGITTGGTTTMYGSAMNDNNGFSRSTTVLVPSGSSVGIYYMDNLTVNVLTSTRVRFTVLVAANGPTGAPAPTIPIAMMAMTPTVSPQAIPAITTTVIQWGTTDNTQSTGIYGLVYAAGVFTNVSSVSMPLTIEYALFLDTTGQGTSSIGINGSSQVYGTMYNDNNCFTNSYTILLAPGSNVGVYYYDNNAVNILGTSRIMVTLLTTGPQGPTGASQWGSTGQALYYTKGDLYVGTGTAPANISLQGTLNSMTVGQGGGSILTNTAVGTSAIANNTQGANTVALGYYAGYSPTGMTGSNNVYVGSKAVPSSGAATNEIVIGQGATGLGSNTVYIGNAGISSTTLSGSVRSFSYTVTVTATGYAQVIADVLAATNPLYATTGVWQITANATVITNQSGGIAPSAAAYVATNIDYPSYPNVYGSFASVPTLSITGGTSAGSFAGYGIFLNVQGSSAFGIYRVNFLRLN